MLFGYFVPPFGGFGPPWRSAVAAVAVVAVAAAAAVAVARGWDPKGRHRTQTLSAWLAESQT